MSYIGFIENVGALHPMVVSNPEPGLFFLDSLKPLGGRSDASKLWVVGEVPAMAGYPHHSCIAGLLEGSLA